MVLTPFRILKNRFLKNERTHEENPKRNLTRVRVHISYRNDAVFYMFSEFRHFCMKTEKHYKTNENNWNLS